MTEQKHLLGTGSKILLGANTVTEKTKTKYPLILPYAGSIMTDIVDHSRSTALERAVKYYWGKVGELKSILPRHNPRP